MTHTETMSAIRGARDMLRECAKQFRSTGDGAGHGIMADAHADILHQTLRHLKS